MNLSKIMSLLAALLLLTAMALPVLAEETEPTGETTETAETTETVEETEAEDVEATEETGAPASRETSGTCGNGLSWELSGSTLTISGSGEMADGSPWAGHKSSVRTVILSGGVTKVGAGAFDGFESITAVDFGGSLKEIGEGAFRNCLGLKEISLPATFRLFGPEAFFGCSNLENVYCEGGMPSFRGNCLWTGNHITIYYPLDNPWPQEAVQTLSDNFGGRLEMVAGSGGAVRTQTTRTEETLPPETVPPTTVPPTTEPPTVPTQPPETRPVVTIPTTPETEAAPTEEVIYTLPTMVTQPAEEPAEKDGLSGGVIGILLVVGVLSFFIVGALIARGVSRRKYYD